jgi:chemotaxis protein CheD
MNIIVGIADMKITNDRKSTLITYALGSCIGLTLYDPLTKVGGLLHFMLPDSQIDTQKAKTNPWMFADTAIPLFLQEICQMGGDKRRLRIKVAGGSNILDDSGFFNIGKRNYMTLRRILWTHNLLIHGEDVGGQSNRSLSLELSTGKVFVKTSGNGIKEI